MRFRVLSSSLARGILKARLVVLLTGLAVAAACTSKSPAEPTPAGTNPSPGASPNVSVVSMAVASETLVSGAHVYRVTVKLRESGGAAATIASVDLTFMNGSATIASAHSDHPISDAANLLAANATIDTRELVSTDEDRSHPHATSVAAKVNYTYGAAVTKSADATAAVPLSAAPTFTLAGVITEETAAGGPVLRATIQVLDGANAGKSSSGDGGGNYTLTELAAGSFTVRATASGYITAEQGVTVAADTRLDLKMQRAPVAPPPPPPPPPPSGACAYTVNPTYSGIEYTGGSLTTTISRTSGTCSWQASADVSWISFPAGASGNGNATLTYLVAPGGLDTRAGHVTISWTGGSAQIMVQQGPPDPQFCVWASSGPQDFDNVPSAGGQLTVTVTNADCGVLAFSQAPWVTPPPSTRPGRLPTRSSSTWHPILRQHCANRTAAVHEASCEFIQVTSVVRNSEKGATRGFKGSRVQGRVLEGEPLNSNPEP